MDKRERNDIFRVLDEETLKNQQERCPIQKLPFSEADSLDCRTGRKQPEASGKRGNADFSGGSRALYSEK